MEETEKHRHSKFYGSKNETSRQQSIIFNFKFYLIKRMYSWKLNKENKCLVMNIEFFVAVLHFFNRIEKNG